MEVWIVLDGTDKDEETYLLNFVFVPVFQHFLINECV